jgi:fibronectin-binding autotransporter adhesin
VNRTASPFPDAGSVGVGTAGPVKSVSAAGNVDYVYAGEIDGPITADGAIGGVHATLDITGNIEAKNGDIGGISAYDLVGNVKADRGNIGSGAVPDPDLYAQSRWQSLVYPQPLSNVSVADTLSGSLDAPLGSIDDVTAGTITAPEISAADSIGEVTASQSISGTEIIANSGSLAGVAVGPGGVSNASIYAGTDLGNVTALGAVNDSAIEARGNIGTIGTLLLSNVNIDAGSSPLPSGEAQGEGGSNGSGSSTATGNITAILAGTSISGTITAGGNIGTISTRIGGGDATYRGGLAQDISGTITAGGSISSITAGRNLKATVNAVNLPAVTVDRDLSGAITASGDIGTVYVQRNITQPIQGNTIATVTAGYDIAKGADITSNQGISGVQAGHTLAGNVTAKAGGINTVAAGSQNAGQGNLVCFGPPNDALSQGSISGSTIIATGDIQNLIAYAGPGQPGGDISGATINAADITSIWAGGSVGATITASGSIESITSGASMHAGVLVRADGGDISGSISAGTSIDTISGAQIYRLKFDPRQDAVGWRCHHGPLVTGGRAWRRGAR